MTPITANPPSLPRTTFMTHILITLNVGVFLFLQGSGGPTYENLLLFGAKENGLIASGQVGRLFFPMFLHANLVHLGFNMWGLFQVGRYLELLIGPRKLVFLYLVTGVTGNMASFAFVDPLSVGASGALFGFLSCLWILQKYEERLASEMNEPVQKTTLGMLIVFNFALGFVIPNIDWACHLGGCLAGVLFGVSLVMRHRWNLRVIGAARYLTGTTGLAKPPLVEREGAWLSLVALLNALLALGYFRVDDVTRAFGRGTLAAAENFTDPKGPEMLSHYKVLVASPKSEGNPYALLVRAVAMHRGGAFASSALVYDVLLQFNEHGVGDEAFASQTTRAALLALRERARKAKVPSDDLVAALGTLPQNGDVIPGSGGVGGPSRGEGLARACLEPADLLRTLGFFGLAGKLYECAFYFDVSRVDVAADVYECYWREDEGDKTNVERFRRIHTHLEGAPLVRGTRGGRAERSSPGAAGTEETAEDNADASGATDDDAKGEKRR